jgi:hypothetical protein
VSLHGLNFKMISRLGRLQRVPWNAFARGQPLHLTAANTSRCRATVLAATKSPALSTSTHSKSLSEYDGGIHLGPKPPASCIATVKESDEASTGKADVAMLQHEINVNTKLCKLNLLSESDTQLVSALRFLRRKGDFTDIHTYLRMHSAYVSIDQIAQATKRLAELRKHYKPNNHIEQKFLASVPPFVVLLDTCIYLNCNKEIAKVLEMTTVDPKMASIVGARRLVRATKALHLLQAKASMVHLPQQLFSQLGRVNSLFDELAHPDVRLNQSILAAPFFEPVNALFNLTPMEISLVNRLSAWLLNEPEATKRRSYVFEMLWELQGESNGLVGYSPLTQELHYRICI